MNADRLLEVYEQISEAPDAIARLRRFVLDLAVRGKLVEQDAGDEPASDLLKKIALDRTQKRTSRSKTQSTATISSLAAGATPPLGWEIVSLGDLINGHLGGGTPSKTNPSYWDGDIRWASVKDVGKTKYIDDTIDRITEEGLAASSSNLIPEGNLIVVTRMGLGQLSINRVPVAINQDLRALFLSSSINVDYIYNFFLTYSVEGTGLTVKGIKLNELLSIAVPLPPLAEQHRIVAKVDELMALCDRLEEARKTREETRDKLTAASLARLTAPDTTPEDFPAHANFAVEALPALTTRPDQIKTLRQTILNLAVRGKLVEQDPADEPASELIRRIEQAPKASIRGRGPQSEVIVIPPTFRIPDNWAWIEFGRLPTQLRVGLDRGKQKQGENLEFGYFKMNNIGNQGGMDMSQLSRIDASQDEVDSFKLQDGDFLFNTRNSRELVGKTCVYRPQTSDTVLYNNNILRAKFSDDVCPDFVDIWFRSPLGRELAETLKSNTTNVCAIYQGKLLSYPVPLPPLAEQRRIVAKIDALTALCDRLEAALTTTDTTRTRLLEALLNEALEPATEALKVAE